MVIVFAPIHFLVLLAFSTCYFSPINTTISPIFNPPTSPITKPHKLVSKLIHPHSVHHPTYNPNDTIKDLAERDMKNSIARFAYLQAISQGSSLATNDVDLRASIFPPISGLLLANISIGQPPIPQFLVVDTGSFLLWVMCIPCTNCPQHSAGPIFDPAKSSTFSTLPCQDSTCHKFLHHCHCIDLDQVAYWIKYLDNTTTAGIIAQEQLLFETSDEGTAVVPNVTFGCGYINKFRKEPQWNGILGLGSEESLVSQLGNRFSYCIGSITDSQYTYNQLVLGEGADLQGYSTPFRAINGLYYVTLQSISVGERTINTDPKTFQRNEDGSGGVIIDSGTTVTRIGDVAYESLFKEVQDLMNGLLTQVVYKNEPWRLCYRGTLSQDLAGFPVITFHFALGAELALDAGSFFYQNTAATFCMAVFPNNSHAKNRQFSIVGLLAQQNYNVGYDLDDELIYFQRIDCELLSD